VYATWQELLLLCYKRTSVRVIVSVVFCWNILGTFAYAT
jgi:hypothetical protein